MKPTAKQFKNELLKRLGENKSAWGKQELVLFIEKVYDEFLECYLED